MFVFFGIKGIDVMLMNGWNVSFLFVFSSTVPYKGNLCHPLESGSMLSVAAGAQGESEEQREEVVGAGWGEEMQSRPGSLPDCEQV